MAYRAEKKDFSYRDLLYKALIFIATVAIIAYFMPRDSKFSYQFDIGKPWKYGQLIATFDFPIYKDEHVVKREQDSIFASFQPYYQSDKQTAADAIKRWENDCKGHLKTILPTAEYQRHISKLLTEIYHTGILSTEEQARLHKDSTEHIMVVKDKMAQSGAVEDFYSVKKAYTYLMSADTLPTWYMTKQEQRQPAKRCSTAIPGPAASC